MSLGSLLLWLAVYSATSLFIPGNLAVGGWLSYTTVIPLVVVPVYLGILPGVTTAAAILAVVAAFRVGTGAGSDLDVALMWMLRVLTVMIPIVAGAVGGAIIRLRRAVRYERLVQREANHRIKNSLSLAASALSIVRASVEDEQAVHALTKAQNQVRTIAGVHETLALQNELRDLPLSSYLDRIARQFRDATPDRPVIEVSGDPVITDSRLAVACGLIVTELSLNAIKHHPAQPDENWTCARVHVRAIDSGRRVELQIEHPSSALPADFVLDHDDGLGINIIHELVSQHDGSWQVLSRVPASFLVVMRNRWDGEQRLPATARDTTKRRAPLDPRTS